ncbi:hypothetical protein HMN09_01411500 [Mycena chlorophos]|uniref:Uncharacterized protein n=1 Tax=Mycena chlorophos TaxID=658473 RepID=A0A8H6RWN2_MYCCL|nr:hypothetical protein HMN09_01411500 [Mycena chlorophos]
MPPKASVRGHGKQSKRKITPYRPPREQIFFYIHNLWQTSWPQPTPKELAPPQVDQAIAWFLILTRALTGTLPCPEHVILFKGTGQAVCDSIIQLDAADISASIDVFDAILGGHNPDEFLHPGVQYAIDRSSAKISIFKYDYEHRGSPETQLRWDAYTASEELKAREDDPLKSLDMNLNALKTGQQYPSAPPRHPSRVPALVFPATSRSSLLPPTQTSSAQPGTYTDATAPTTLPSSTPDLFAGPSTVPAALALSGSRAPSSPPATNPDSATLLSIPATRHYARFRIEDESPFEFSV